MALGMRDRFRAKQRALATDLLHEPVTGYGWGRGPIGLPPLDALPTLALGLFVAAVVLLFGLPLLAALIAVVYGVRAAVPERAVAATADELVLLRFNQFTGRPAAPLDRRPGPADPTPVRWNRMRVSFGAESITMTRRELQQIIGDQHHVE